MNILFKCDQSNQIGLGHLHRSTALAEIFKKNSHKCFFLGLKPGLVKKNRISKHDQRKDLEYTTKFIKKKNIKLIVKDLYSLKYEWEKNISKNNFLVVIDDFRSFNHYCDIYVNYHFNWFKKRNNKFLKKKNCIKLIGPKYTIVKNFEKKKKLRFKDKTIFIYMGGADKKLYMEKIINIFINKKFNKFKKIFLINNNHLKRKNLIKKLSQIKNVKVFKNKINNFYQYLKYCDLCITSAGHTMLEQITLKKKGFIVPQNNIQKKIALSLKKKGLISLPANIKKINNILIDDLILKNKIKTNLINRYGKYLIYKKIMSHYKN